MRTIRLAFLAILFLVCLLFDQTFAQPLARFVLPTSNSKISVQPVFRIVTAYPIDTSSIHWNPFSSDEDSAWRPTFCVVSRNSYQTQPDSVWGHLATMGTGQIIDDSTIEYQPLVLGQGKEFSVILMGLRVINGEDTITIPDTVRFHFSTVDPLPKILKVSCMGLAEGVKMHDTVTVKFTTKLDSVNGGGGPLVSLIHRIAYFDSTADSTVAYDSAIHVTAWLDSEDSSLLHVLATDGFVPAENYGVIVRLSNLTGDSSGDYYGGFKCRSFFRLRITAIASNGLISMPWIHFDPLINEQYRLAIDTVMHDTTVVIDSAYFGQIVNAGETVTFTAPLQVGGAVFKQWGGSGSQIIDTSTNPVLTLLQNADELHDLNIVAYYKPVAVDTISVTVSVPDTIDAAVHIWSDSQDYHITLEDTTSTSASYITERAKPVTLHAYSTSDSTATNPSWFDHWSSANSLINGQTSPTICISSTGNVSATAIFHRGNPVLPPGELPYKICAYVIDDSGRQVPHADAKIVSPAFPAACSGGLSCSVFATMLRIYDPSYQLKSYTINGGKCTNNHLSKNFPKILSTHFPKDLFIATTTPDPYPCLGDGSFTPPEITKRDNPTTSVTYVITRVARVLRVIIRMDDDCVPKQALILPHQASDTNKLKMWCYVYPEPLSSGCSAVYANGHTDLVYNLYYPATNSPTVHIKCGTRDGFKFKNWVSASGNTDWPTPTTVKNLDVVIDQPLKICTAIFNSPFMLESITYYQWRGPAPGVNPMTDPDPWGGNPSGGVDKVTRPVDDAWRLNAERISDPTQGPRAWAYGLWTDATEWAPPVNRNGISDNLPDYDPARPVKIFLKFNKKVHADFNFYDDFDINFEEETPAYARGYVQTKYPITFRCSYCDLDYHHNARLTSDDGKEIEISLMGTYLVHLVENDTKQIYPYRREGCDNWAVWKGQRFVFRVGEQVRSEEGNEKLSNPQSFTLHTENPDIKWKYWNSYLYHTNTNLCRSSVLGWAIIFAACYGDNNSSTASIKLSNVDEHAGNDHNMIYHEPVTLPHTIYYTTLGSMPTPYLGDGDIRSSENEPAPIAECSHCRNDRQFEASIEVCTSEGRPNAGLCWLLLTDNFDFSIRDWGSDYYCELTRRYPEYYCAACPSEEPRVTAIERGDYKGHLQDGMFNLNNDHPDVDISLGRAHYPPTGLHPQTADFWGANDTYINTNLLKQLDSNDGSDANSRFRAEMRIEVK